MEDYAGNSHKAKDAEKTPPTPPKKVEKVIKGTAIVQKKSLGRKFRDIFVEADFKSVVKYVVSDVLIPAARNMIVDASTKGVERMMYGDRGRRYPWGSSGPAPRFTYNNPINRPYPGRMAPGVEPGPRRSSRHDQGDFILSSREEADMVLERMNDILSQYEVASVADLKELVGFPSSHVDNKWGWVYLGDVQIRQVREGYLLDLPAAEPLK